jgi:hypothetical protein
VVPDVNSALERAGMTNEVTASLELFHKRIMAAPTAEDLWSLQAHLLAVGSADALHARRVAGEFHKCLRCFQSKVASRSASRWGAVLETASVTSVGVQEMLTRQEAPLKRLLASGVTALLEVAAASKNVEAWETEASLMYYDVGWYLYAELWDVSLLSNPDLSEEERKSTVDQLLKPVIDSQVSDTARSALIVGLFQVLLSARMAALLKPKK